jgi:hypothetical protein
MKLHNVIIVVLRLVLIEAALKACIQVPLQLLAKDPRPATLLMTFVAMTVALALLGVLWVVSGKIARLVMRKVPEEISFGQMSLLDCYTIAFVGIGLYFLALNVSPILNWGVYLLKLASASPGATWTDQVNFYTVADFGISFVVGLVLFLNGRRWARSMAFRDEQIDSAVGTTEPPPNL